LGIANRDAEAGTRRAEEGAGTDKDGEGNMEDGKGKIEDSLPFSRGGLRKSTINHPQPLL